ncbi:MAG: hypothetical protein E7173_00455 [Firmicutes bacterium]|nr:hypothetical protein [Bacillota bacterium]
MSPNNFQKNPFVSNNATSSYKPKHFSNYDKLGRRTVEEVKQDMVDVKYNNFKERQERNTEIVSTPQPKHTPDFKDRVNNLRNINRG